MTETATRETPLRPVDLYELTWRHGRDEYAVRLEREPALSLFAALTLLADFRGVGLAKSSWRSWVPDERAADHE